MLELRRRVQADPASIAFAQVAEECRRAGSNEEAVTICRAGLKRYPDYLSARVTLARALIELERLDEAQVELNLVVADVPDNLTAIRGLAEIFQRRGQMPEALAHYKHALGLARYDPDLEDTVERISQAVAPPPAAEPPPLPPMAIEDLFDFDTLVQQLGGVPMASVVPTVLDVPDVPSVSAFAGESRASEGGPEVPSVLDSVVLDADEQDNLATMARQIEELEEQRAKDEQLNRATLAARRRQAVLKGLESWLSAIVADGQQHSV